MYFILYFNIYIFHMYIYTYFGVCVYIKSEARSLHCLPKDTKLVTESPDFMVSF